MTLLENTIRQGAAPPHRNELNELAHVARLALMNEMVCGLAHELKQPLAAIANYACAGRYTALAANSSLHPSVVPLFDRIAEQAERAGKIVGCLRDFVSRHDGPRAVVDLNELVRHAMVLLEVDARVHDVSLALCLDARSCLVEVDRIQIEQVVVNLVKNAMEAAAEMPPPRRRVTVRTATIDVMAAPPHAVELAVSDEAAGLKAAELERVCKPFYTTKPDGMGLGLSICRSILQSHHSRLEVLSHEGLGTTFRFLLPVSAKESYRG